MNTQGRSDDSEADEDTSFTAQKEHTHNQHSGLDTKIQERLGRQLKALYDDVVKQPVPDRLLILMAQLESAEGPCDK